MIKLGKCLHELLQIGILCDHERRDWNLLFSTDDCLIERSVYNHRIETKGVLVDAAVTAIDHRRFAIGDHEDLLVRALAAQQYLPGEL